MPESFNLRYSTSLKTHTFQSIQSNVVRYSGLYRLGLYQICHICEFHELHRYCFFDVCYLTAVVIMLDKIFTTAQHACLFYVMLQPQKYKLQCHRLQRHHIHWMVWEHVQPGVGRWRLLLKCNQMIRLLMLPFFFSFLFCTWAIDDWLNLTKQHPNHDMKDGITLDWI